MCISCRGEWRGKKINLDFDQTSTNNGKNMTVSFAVAILKAMQEERKKKKMKITSLMSIISFY